MTALDSLINRVHHADCFDLLAMIPDGTVDAIITDPPYGLKLDTWDNAIEDLPRLMSEFHRVMKPDSFLALTSQMPYMLDWCNAAHEAFDYVEHVTWLKRLTGAYSAGLFHSHESVLIYRKGMARFVETEGRYSDVKVPGLLFDAMSAEGLQRYIDELWAVARGKSPSKRPSAGRHIAHERRSVFTNRVQEFSNFTNVWSFLPQNSNPTEKIVGHASVKPIKLFERLVPLLTTPDSIVLDCFSGSGTTAVAARNTGRRYIAGDSSAEYVAIARDRLRMPFEPRQVEPKSEPLEDLPLFAAGN